MITFTREKVNKFKRAYNKAVKEKKESFIFNDREVLTSYAKYMIEYLNTRL